MQEASILVTGGTGVLGWRLCRYLAERGYPVTATYRQRHPHLEGVHWRKLELEDPDSIAAVASAEPYRAVIHTAAWTNPDHCEEDPARTRQINVTATRELLQGLAGGAPFLYVSTDLVFDGTRGNYREEDPVHPVNRYAESKVAAEEIVRADPRGIVLRMAKIYSLGSPSHPCFVTWICGHLEEGRPVALFEDQFRSPVFVLDVTRALERLLGSRPRWNLYHLGGPERLSRLEFGRELARIFGFDSGLLRATRFESLGLVPRGKDCSLDSSRFVREFDFHRTPLQEGLRALKELARRERSR